MKKDNTHFSDEDLKEFVLFQIHRNVINLYKRFIIITEDLHKDHKIYIDKLKKESGSDLAEKIDYFDDEKYTYIRKKILDAGNALNRDIEKYFELLDLRLNSESLEKNKKFRVPDNIRQISRR